MSTLNTVEIKAFLPAKDFEASKNFYCDIGFIKASDEGGVAYFHHGQCSFLLQDFYDKALAENFVMHLLVEDVDSWHQHVCKSGVAETYLVKVSEVVTQAWGMRDFTVLDPSGVLWRIGQNV